MINISFQLEEILRVNEFLADPVDMTPERLRKLSNSTLGTGNRTSSLLLNRSNISGFSTPAGMGPLEDYGGTDDTLMNEFGFLFNEDQTGTTATKQVSIENLLHPMIARDSEDLTGKPVNGKDLKARKRPQNLLVLFDEEIMLDRNQMFKELSVPLPKRKRKSLRGEEMIKILVLPFDEFTSRAFFLCEPNEGALAPRNSSITFSTISNPANYWHDDSQLNHSNYDYIDDPIEDKFTLTESPESKRLSDIFNSGSGSPIIFNDLFKSRRQVCKAFYGLLTCLNMRQITRVEQPHPFDRIIIIPNK
jgi:hypothetical protein